MITQRLGYGQSLSEKSSVIFGKVSGGWSPTDVCARYHHKKRTQQVNMIVKIPARDEAFAPPLWRGPMSGMSRFQFSLANAFRWALVVCLVVGAWAGYSRFARRFAPKQQRDDSAVIELPERLLVLNPREVIREALSGPTAITFLSWNGEWIGTDVDTEINLMADGTVRLTEYGIGMDSYDGTYSINENSELLLSLAGYEGNWPAMRVYRDQSVLLLAPADTSNATRIGSRWPFRQIVD